MGTINSAQRDGKRDGDTVTEASAGQDESQDDSAEDKLLQKNGQISNLKEKTENLAEELKCPCEERVLAEVGSGFVTIKEDGTETIEDLQEGDTSQTNTEELGKEMFNEDGVMVKKEVDEVDNKQNDIEVGFKKIFRFVGFKFTLKKDKTQVDETVTNEQNKTAAIHSEDSRETTEGNPVSTNEQDAEEMQKDVLKSDVQTESTDSKISPESENEICQISEITEHNEETTPDEEQVIITQSPKSEVPMSPIKRFFTQRIFASLRKKRKEEETPKENKEEDLQRTDEVEGEKMEEDAKRSTCVCLDFTNTTPKEVQDLQTGERDEVAREGEIIQEQDKVQASPLIRLFRKLSTRRQRDTKPAETNLAEPEENLKENLQSSEELIKVQNEQDEATTEEPKPVDEDQVANISPESKKKSDSTVSWDSLICIGSSKKRGRKTPDSEDAMQDKGETPQKTSESPLGSSTEGDYEHLTSSNEQAGSHAEDESGSTWKSLKKLVTPKRKARMEEGGSSEQIPSDTEITKDESACSLKKLIPGRKKRKSDGRQEHSSSDEAGKGTETDNEDDETPAIVPLSEYEIIEPESVKEMIYVMEIEKETQQMTEDDKPKEAIPSVKSSNDVEPIVVPVPSDYIEELTEFISKHQQLSDIPEEGIIEESVVTPVSSAEWTTQDDTLAEDIVELTADAVTAPEPVTEPLNGDESTEMVSAVSQLTESPKTSGNVTPAQAEYDMRETDVILQEAVETICMTPSVISITTKDKDPEALAVSVSPCIVESTVTAETKVLVAHEKTEATSICIGVVSQELVDAEEVLSLNLVEGISEISEAVTTELVSEEITEESELAGVATDDVHEAEVKEIKTEMREETLPDEPSTPSAEMEKEVDQASEIDADIKESSLSDVFLVVQTEEVTEYPPELIHENQELTQVPMAVINAVQCESLVLEEEVIKNDTNEVADTEAPLEITLEKHVHEQPALYAETTAEVEKKHTLPDFKLAATEVEQVTLDEVTEMVTQSAMDSVPDSTINEASAIPEDVIQVNLAEVAETVTHNVEVTGLGTSMDEASEVTEGMLEVLASTIECPANTEVTGTVSPVSDSISEMTAELKDEVQMDNIPSLDIDSHAKQVEMKNIELTAKANVETVLDVTTALNVAEIYDKAEEIREEVATAQQSECITAEESGETCAEEIVQNNIVENLLETKEHLCEEDDLNKEISTTEVSFAVTVTTAESSAAEEPHEVSEVTVDLTKEQTKISIFMEDDKTKQSTGEIDIETLTEAENIQAPVTSEQTCLQEEVTEEKCEPLTVEAEVQPETVIVEFSVDTKNAEVASESVEDTALTEASGTCTDADALISSTLSEDTPEDKEKTAEVTESEINSKVDKEPQETIETVTPSLKAEPQVVIEQLQIETLQPDQSQVTESSLQICKEDNQAAEDSVNVTKTVSDITDVEEAKQSIVISSTDVASVEFEQTQEECTTDEPEGKGFEISEPPMETEQHVEAELVEDIITVTTVEAAKVEDSLAVNQEPEALITPAIKVDEPVVEVNEVIQESREVVSEEKVETGAGSEQSTESPCVTEVTALQVEKGESTETGIETLPVMELKEETTMTISEVEMTTEQITEPPVVTENKIEMLSVIQHEVQTQVMTELKAEALEETEPKVETHVITEVKLETAVVTELEVETPVVTSVVTELEVETPVVTSVANSLDANTTVIESVIKDTKVHPVLTEPVDVKGTTVEEMAPAEEKTAVVPEIPTATVVSELQTPVSKVEEKAAGVLEEKDINDKLPFAVDVMEPKLEIPKATVVSELQTPVSKVEEKAAGVLEEKDINDKLPFAVDVMEPKLEIPKATVVSELQTPVSKVEEKAAEVLEEKDIKAKIPIAVDVIEPKLEIPAAAETIIRTAVSEPKAPTLALAPALETKTLVGTSVENSVDVQSPVVTSKTENTEIEISVLPSTTNEPEIKTPVIPEVQTPVEVPVLQTSTVVSTTQVPAVVTLLQEPEVPVVILETKETPDAADVSTLEITAPEVQEVRVETSVEAGVEIKDLAVTSVVTKLEVTPVKKEPEASVLTPVVEEPVVTSVPNPPRLVPVVQTSTMVETTADVTVHKPAVVQIPTIISSVQTLAADIAVKKAEMPVVESEVKETQETKNKEASVAVEAEVKSQCPTDVKLQVKEESEHCIQKVESAAESKETPESLATVSEPKEAVVSMAAAAEPLPDVEDDVWEDAVDVIKDDESSITKANGELKDTTK